MKNTELFTKIIEGDSAAIASSAPENVLGVTSAYGVPGAPNTTAEKQTGKFWPEKNKYSADATKLAEKYVDRTQYHPESYEDLLLRIEKFFKNKYFLQDWKFDVRRKAGLKQFMIVVEKKEMSPLRFIYDSEISKTFKISNAPITCINDTKNFMDILEVLLQISDMIADLKWED